MISRLRQKLRALSFRTGLTLLLLCVPFYLMSFGQMLLPLSAAAKGILWMVLFGLAKTFQYAGLTVIGAEGVRRLRNRFRRSRSRTS